MRKFLSLAVMCSLALPAMALAQEYEEAEAEATEMAAPPETAEMPESPKMAADDIEPAEEGGRPFLDGLSWQVMASAFYRIGGYAGDGVRAGTYNNILDAEQPLGYPYTNYNGFGLNFAGGDLMYTGEKFALRLDLRFGTAADLLTPISAAGFGGVKQAYVSWLPADKINIDVGFFDTIYGAEVVDEWENANYTRGALYFLRQPFNHMGLRMGIEMTDVAGFTMMVTNGGVYGGTPIDDNETPALGWQFGFTPDGHNSVRRRGLREGYREVGIFFGGNHAASGNNGNRDWQNFFDIVVSLDLKWFHLLLNGDYFLDGKQRNAAGEETADFQYGHSLALIFDMSDKWSLGMRGEHLSGNDLFQEQTTSFGGLATGTLTLRYKPVEYLVISLEGRGEWSTRDIYFSRSATTDANDVLIPNEKMNYAAILGVTAHIGN